MAEKNQLPLSGKPVLRTFSPDQCMCLQHWRQQKRQSHSHHSAPQRTWIQNITTLNQHSNVFLLIALELLFFFFFNEMPVQVRCTILDAWGWCTGTTQRDGMGREEGGGFRMGNTCIPVVDSFWYLAKLIQLCKV